jgi:cellulose synthase/poly-beta-1,6-N-acetylglucosamine synthase-like glycosyltransferase
MYIFRHRHLLLWLYCLQFILVVVVFASDPTCDNGVLNKEVGLCCSHRCGDACGSNVCEEIGILYDTSCCLQSIERSCVNHPAPCRINTSSSIYNQLMWKVIIIFSVFGGFLLLTILYSHLRTLTKYLDLKRKARLNVYFYITINLSLITLLFFQYDGIIMTSALISLGHIRDSFFAITYYPLKFIKSIYLKIKWYGQRSDISTRNSTRRSKNIVNVIPCYAESYEIVDETIASIERAAYFKQVFIVIIDGDSLRNEGKFHEQYDTIGSSTTTNYINWKKDKIDLSFTYCLTRGKKNPCILIKKNTNTGKKCSLILSHQLILDVFSDSEIYKDWRVVRTIRDWLFGQGFNSVDYVFHTDADTFVGTDCVSKLVRECSINEADAACGFVKVDFRNAHNVFNFWNNFQYCQYHINQILRRRFESLFNSVVCMPGCVTLLKFSNNYDIWAKTLSRYCRLPKPNEFFSTVSIMQGTDRHYTKCLLKERGRIVMCDDAFVYTTTPQSSKTYISQRKRWSSNCLSNSVTYFSSNKLNWFIKINSSFNILKIYTTPFRLISVIVFLANIGSISLQQIIMLLIFVGPYLVFELGHFVFFEKEFRFQLFLGLILNKIFNPLLGIRIISKMIVGMLNFKWMIGSTESNGSIV